MDDMRCVFMGDERRGLWFKRSATSVTIKAGREGDDAESTLEIGDTVTPELLVSMLDVLETAEWAWSGDLSNRIKS